MAEYLYGSVYKVTREDTPAGIDWDFQKMRQCGMDTVVIWPPVFYWEEKSPDYPFHTGKMILDLAEKNGLKVIMELAGQLSVFEYIPDWEMKPDYYALNEAGCREWGQDSFGFLNYFHPEVKEKICAQYRAVAAAYKNHPALLAYDVFNETMYRSFDEYTMEAFRNWLREKYGTIEKVNQVWERTYTSFDQIRYEHHKWMSIMPKADYFAFRKASVGIFLKDWCEAIRQIDPVHPLIADNIHSQVTLKSDYLRPQDDYDLKKHVDQIGMSFYPKGVGGPFEPALRHQIFSGFYDASQGDGFLVSEMQTHIQALFNPDTAVRTWELKQWCYEAYASGAKGLIYWMWRPFTKGLQTMGRGLVDYKNRETPRFTAAQKIGTAFREHGPLTPVTGRVGVVYDSLCEDFQRLYTEAYRVDQQIYLASLYGAYKMLFDLNIPCDMIRMDEIEKYDAVILSNKLVMTQQDGEALRRYVEKGGLCITDGKFGTVDEESMTWRAQPGGCVNELTGLDYLDTDYENLRISGALGACDGYYCREINQVLDADILATFADGTCAVAEKHTGQGSLVTLNTFLFYGYYKCNDSLMYTLIARLLAEKDILPVCSNGQIKVKLARGGSGYVVVAFNYSDEPQTGEVYYNGKTKELMLEANEVMIKSWED